MLNGNLMVLLDVLKCSLNGKTFDEKIENEKDFYYLSRDNGLIGLIYESVDFSMQSEQLKTFMNRDFLAFISSDEKQRNLIDLLTKIFDEAEIKNVFLKGSVLKFLYPKTYNRGMGDIDVLVESENLNLVDKLLKEKGFILEHLSEQHNVYSYMGLSVEVHPRLVRDFNNRFEKLFDKPWEEVILVEGFNYKFKHEYMICYLLYHLAKHLGTSGVGIRSVLDIGIYMNYYKDEINRDYLFTLLDESQMMKLFDGVIYLNSKYFGFEKLSMYLTHEPLSKERYENMLIYIAKAGIHGKGRDFNPFEGRRSFYELQNKGKFRFIIEMIFPSKKAINGMYPFTRKCVLLVPIGWVFRWFRLVFRSGKSSIRKIKYLKTDENSLDFSKEVLRDLDIL